MRTTLNTGRGNLKGAACSDAIADRPQARLISVREFATGLIGIDTRGEGPTILMLPALSSISTRSEMRPLAEQLASDFTTIAVDWPGFGDRPRPEVAWEPHAYQKFLGHILQELPKPTATVAAGHAAGYLLAHAAEHPGSVGRLCLVAPTWRGPLPTMMGGRHAMSRFISRLVDLFRPLQTER